MHITKPIYSDAETVSWPCSERIILTPILTRDKPQRGFFWCKTVTGPTREGDQRIGNLFGMWVFGFGALLFLRCD